MPKLPGINHRQAIRAFQKAGFRVIRESGHIIMSNGTTTLIIPRHNPVNQYVMAGLVKDAGLTSEQFKNLIR